MFFASSQIVVKKLKTLGQRGRWGWGLKYQGGIFVGGGWYLIAFMKGQMCLPLFAA